MRVIQHFLSARNDRVEFLHDPISFGRQSLQVPSRKPVHAYLLLPEFLSANARPIGAEG
jgi:hypothetical protein